MWLQRASLLHLPTVLLLLLVVEGSWAFLSPQLPRISGSSAPLLQWQRATLFGPLGCSRPPRRAGLAMEMGGIEQFDHEVVDPAPHLQWSPLSAHLRPLQSTGGPRLAACVKVGSCDNPPFARKHPRILTPSAVRFKHKATTQEMLRKEARENNGRIGVVFSAADHEGSFATVGCEAAIESLTQLDDGRLIVECTGTRRFRVQEVYQKEPYLRASVDYLEDSDGGSDDEPRGVENEVECWKTLQEVVWLCVEVWDKRSWMSLLMTGGKGHPLHRFRETAPPQSGGEGADPASEHDRSERFSWQMVSILRNGLPGLWDHDMTDTVSSSSRVQKLLETTSREERLRECLATMKAARDVLRLRQRLKDLVDERGPGDEDEEGEGGAPQD